MDPQRAALENRAGSCVGRIFAVTGAEAIKVQRRLDLIEAIVHAVVEPRPEATPHDTAGLSAGLGQAGLKEQPEVSLNAGAERPRLVRGIDQHTAAGTITEIRHRCLCGRRLLS